MLILLSNKMKTDTIKTSEVPSFDCPSKDSKETMKIARKSLHPLQIAAGDKENLVGAGRMIPTVGEKEPKAVPITSKVSHVSSPPKKEKKKANKNQEKKTVTVEDLTSEEGPSEHYWELLAETRRKALEKALEENQQLHERLETLTEEYNKYKELLNEAQGIIDTLNEIISEANEDDSGVGEEIIRRP